ncbi:MAG: hypothetical protein ACI4T4_00455 [Limosilactobacillus sp.]
MFEKISQIYQWIVDKIIYVIIYPISGKRRPEQSVKKIDDKVPADNSNQQVEEQTTPVRAADSTHHAHEDGNNSIKEASKVCVAPAIKKAEAKTHFESKNSQVGKTKGKTKQKAKPKTKSNKPRSKRKIPSNSKFERRKGKIVYPLSNHTFLTRSNLNYCTSHHHKLADIYGRVSVMMGDKICDVRFPAVYCQTCDKFFILEHIYKWLQSKGRVLCRVVTNDYWIPKITPIKTTCSSDTYGDPESRLHYLGYNVNSQNGLSKAQRRHILRHIIVNKEMTQAEIESHLAYLIRRNQYNANFQMAIEKWYEDLLFVEKIDLNYSRIPVEELRVNRYHRY